MLDELHGLADLSAQQVQSRFEQVASNLLHRTQLVAFGRVCQVLEVEFYLFSNSHPDPYSHRQEIQKSFGRWYFHRVGSGYRNGTFKGLDFTFGSEHSFGGGLIRSLATDAGSVICGPSLCVDYLLSLSDCRSVPELDARLGQADVRSPSSVLRLKVVGASMPQETIYKCPRVGLSTGTLPGESRPHEYAARDYRFLVRPRAIKKGRAQLIQGMARAGYPPEQIRELTGSPLKAIEKHIAAISVASGLNSTADRTFQAGHGAGE